MRITNLSKNHRFINLLIFLRIWVSRISKITGSTVGKDCDAVAESDNTLSKNLLRTIK